MDHSGNRGVRPQQPIAAAPIGSAQVPGTAHNSKLKYSPKALRIGFVALLFAATALIVTLAVAFSLGGRGDSLGGGSESKLVKQDKYQAVFLNGGQVYFGKIKEFNGRYIKLDDIYYLRVQQQVQPGSQEPKQDISLAKLGNELHGPEDSMAINREQVIFWENLKDDGQVVKAIIDYKKNPDAANQQQGAGTATPAPATPPETPPTGTGTGSGTTTPTTPAPTPAPTTPRRP